MFELLSINAQDCQQLLTLARQSIAFGLTHKKPICLDHREYSDTLQSIASSFVTLTTPASDDKHPLRGCIGSLLATQPLVTDVVEHAFAAAFKDPRFPQLAVSEFDNIHVEISVLTPETEMFFNGELDLLEQLQTGMDGVTIREGSRQATFLPSVWQQLPNKKDFLLQLKRKAGFANDYWSKNVRAFRYYTVSFEEEKTGL